MNVTVRNAVDRPEQLVCSAARNDYEEDWIGEQTFMEAMEDIEPAQAVPEEAYEPIYAEDFHKMSDVPTTDVRKMWTLITHLLDHGHFGPFEHPHITFAVEGVSRSLMAQLTRHRHVTFDIQSMRYVSLEDANPEPGEAVVEIPELDDPGVTGRNAEKDERYQEYDDDEILEARRQQYKAALKQSFKSYRNLLEMGTAPENARMVLPIGTKVNIVFTLNARTLMHVVDMRAAGDAQWEIRQMTEKVLEKARRWMPLTLYYYQENMANRKNRLAP